MKQEQPLLLTSGMFAKHRQYGAQYAADGKQDLRSASGRYPIDQSVIISPVVRSIHPSFS
jgi:hypothetical protein